MNILIITSIDFPNGMASTSLITLIAKGFVKNGINVQLLIHSKSYNQNVIGHDTNEEGFYEGIYYKYFNKNGVNQKSYNFGVYKNIVEVAKYIKYRKKQRFKDAVITYNNDILKNSPIFLTCYLNKIPLFPWEVEKRISAVNKKKIKHKFSYLGYKLSDYVLPKISTGYIVISTSLKKYYSSKINVNKIHITPILIDSENQSKLEILSSCNQVYKEINNIKGVKYIIVYSGSFGEKDGFPYILRAFKLFHAKYQDSILVTTGKSGKYNPIENILREVKEMGLSDNFKHLGLVTREELKFVNQQADLLLVCRSNSEYANHGFPWKLGEYLMTKNPIIATRVGDIEYYFTDKEEIYIAEPENPESVYNLMQEIFNDYYKARLTAENGFEKASKVFDYVGLTKQTICFINKLCTKSRYC